MADFSFSDDRELQMLSAQVIAEPEEFEHWEKLVRAAESQEGGINRNSSPQAISAVRETYDRFLTRFPLFFGYWKKYADLEFSIGGTESAEMVYERGVASIGTSVDLWMNYCSFKVDTNHDADVIRELFERGAESVGLDFLAHPFWDKYLEFEERWEQTRAQNVFAILGRIIHIPLHQYARYFERYQSLGQQRPVDELADKEVLAQVKTAIAGNKTQHQMSDVDYDREMRTNLHNYHVEIFQKTQAETTKRWTYEQEVKRPYYHVTELDEAQLANWRKYLDFEEGEKQHDRIKFLYERCLVTAANYDEFWFRYARWVMGQYEMAEVVRQEEARNIFRRACCTYVPISQHAIRLYYAKFEEASGLADTAVAIHDAILLNLPGHLETIVSLSSVHRRQYGIDSAIGLLTYYASSGECTTDTQGALIAELARLTWKVKGDVGAARAIYQNRQDAFFNCGYFWSSWLAFEIEQPTSAALEGEQHRFIKQVYGDIVNKTHLSPETLKELSSQYFQYLVERGDKDAMKEFVELDFTTNGPLSVANGAKGQSMFNGVGGHVEVNYRPELMENFKRFVHD